MKLAALDLPSGYLLGVCSDLLPNIMAEGIKRTQLVRVEFGPAKYRAVSTESWKTWVTRERVAQLKDLAE